MSKVAIVFWSGTGNTQAMASKIAEGAKGAGAEVSVFTASEFGPEKMGEFDVIAFGCPSMGSEQLEESEFEPMFISCQPKLKGKKIALFGSYGWGSGEWMEEWEGTCTSEGAILVSDSVICPGAPEGDLELQCVDLGKALV